MAITVENLAKQFTWLDRDDLKLLTGKSNFTSSDTISLSNIVLFGNKDINTFVAKKEKDNFISLFKGNELVELVKASGQSPMFSVVQGQLVNSNNLPAYKKIPQGPSIFMS